MLRPKAALGAAKARGTLLGSARPGHWEGREDRRSEGAKAGSIAAAERRRSESEAVYAKARPLIATMRAEGKSLRSIAAALNSEGLTTAGGAAWSPVQVSRLIAAE